MIEFKEIALEDKALFDSYFSSKNYENSEFTFTNNFIWRDAYHFRYTIIQDHLCIMGKYRNRYPFIFAPLSLNTPAYDLVMPALVDVFHQKGYPLIMKSVTMDAKEAIEAVMPKSIIFKEDRSNHDYVYSSKDLIDLSGKMYRQKRNHVNKFIKSYNFEYEVIDENNINECLDIEKTWAEKRNGDKSILEEKKAILELMANFHALKITGGALRINGTIQSFTLGELLNPDMAVIHIEKANIDYDGCYAMINQQFAMNAWSHITLINREEDMGIPGLRKAKESYYPTKMIVKYTGFFL